MNKQGIWRVYDAGFDNYYAERVVKGKSVEYRELDAHCKACAKSDLMAETGIPADIRGWTRQGMCGSFLKAMRATIEEEEEE
jgi:hypothetical protein